MAFDGITIRALTNELNTLLSTCRIVKIAQTEKDELMLTIKGNSSQYRLLISANASLPLIYLTSANKPAPLTAPNYCMLLRKHIGNGRILSVTQRGLERIVDIETESRDEMGDLVKHHLIVELMGKHSNIILLGDNNTIIDSIKRVNASVSSVREVLPGREYFIPNTEDKINLLQDHAQTNEAEIGSDSLPSKEAVADKLLSMNCDICKAIYGAYSGISPQAAMHICAAAGVDANANVRELSEGEMLQISSRFIELLEDIASGNFEPAIIYDNDKPKDFCVISGYESDGGKVKYFTKEECEAPISMMLETFYNEKEVSARIRQRSSTLTQIVSTNLSRAKRKAQLQEKQLKDTEKRDKYRIYGELLLTYGYEAGEGARDLTVNNYYDNTQLTIPLDETLSAADNSKKYFEKYNKLKRTYEALTEQITQTMNEIEHLESIAVALDIARGEEDLAQIREELVASGYMKTGESRKKTAVRSKPLCYISSDGFRMYVGKNNIQNEELSFKVAEKDDWWFHSKKFPGSHVIVKCEGKELPDRTFEEAARLAAHYSKGSDQSLVEIDYVQKKHLRKVAGAPLGFVIYHTNYSMSISPDISAIRQE